MRAARAGGFTLVELITVIAVLAIVIGIAMPEFRDMLAARRVQMAAAGLSQALKSAQAEAIRRNRTVEVIFTTSAPTAANVVSASPTSASAATAWMTRVANPTSAADFIGGTRVADAGNLALENPAVSAIGFTPVGRPVDLSAAPPVALAAPIVLRLTDAASSRRMCVSVSTGGSVRVCDPKRSPPSTAACEPQLPPGAC